MNKCCWVNRLACDSRNIIKAYGGIITAFCSECGSELELNAKFCKVCGKKVGEANPSNNVNNVSRGKAAGWNQ